MKLILDTHAALWWLTGDDRLGRDAERRLLDGRDRVLLSAAVVWEIAIKRSLGKLEAPPDFAATYLDAGAEPLPITLAHAATVETLHPHHRDPFDRMLIAQALTEDAVIVSGDQALKPYGVSTLW